MDIVEHFTIAIQDIHLLVCRPKSRYVDGNARAVVAAHYAVVNKYALNIENSVPWLNVHTTLRQCTLRVDEKAITYNDFIG
jgi:hypothetical protein